MLRILFALLLLLHGLIHLLGFVNQWAIALGTQMSGKSLMTMSAETSKWMGILWLLAGLCFLLTLVSYWLQINWWFTVALFSIALSQVLIIIYWPDAKAGTVANVLIALVLGLVYAHDRFEAQANQEVRHLLMPSTADKSVVTQEMLIQLPMPVQQC